MFRYSEHTGQAMVTLDLATNNFHKFYENTLSSKISKTRSKSVMHVKRAVKFDNITC